MSLEQNFLRILDENKLTNNMSCTSACIDWLEWLKPNIENARGRICQYSVTMESWLFFIVDVQFVESFNLIRFPPHMYVVPLNVN